MKEHGLVWVVQAVVFFSRGPSTGAGLDEGVWADMHLRSIEHGGCKGRAGLLLREMGLGHGCDDYIRGGIYRFRCCTEAQ